MGSTAALLTGLNSFNSSNFYHDELHSSDLDSVDSARDAAEQPLLIKRDPAPAAASGKQPERKQPVLGLLNTEATGRPGPSGRNGKPAARTGGGGVGVQRAASAMTLKEQESVVAELQKLNFDLRLRIVFYEERLGALAPGQIEEALRRNIQYKVSHETDKVELRRYRKREEEVERERQVERRERDELKARVAELEGEVRDGGGGAGDGAGSIDLAVRLEESNAAREDLQQEKDDLEYDLREANTALDEASDEIALLKAAASSTTTDDVQEVAELREQIERLQQENNDVRDRASRQALELDALEADLAERDREIEEIIQALELKESEHARAVERHEAARREDDDEAAKQDEGAKDTIDALMRELALKENVVQSEGEGSKALRSELASLQLRHSSASITVTSLTTRATTAERRLLATQTQLTLLERALADARIKVAAAESTWEVRFRELRTRLLAAEEGLRRERQGARARLAELAATITGLKAQVGDAQRRDGQVGRILAEAVVEDVD